MASVKQFKGSANWYACYRLPNGKRVQRSTGSADKAAALQMAIGYEKAANAAATGQWGNDGAKRFLAELSAITGVKIASREAVGDFLRRWLTMRAHSLAQGSAMRYDSILTGFLAYVGESVAISDVSTSQVATFRDRLIADGLHPNTVNKSLMVLGQVFAEAVTQGLIDRNPARGLNVKGAAKRKQHRRAFTIEQFRALVASLEPTDSTDGRALTAAQLRDWQLFVLLAGYTGGRQQEVARLRWEQVDLRKGVLTLARSKTADTHWIPLHPTLKAALERTPKAERTGPVLPLLAERQRRHISNDFRRLILPRIGIEQAFAERAKGQRGRTLAPYSIHSLRHSLATWLAAAGVEESMRMRLIGHEDEAINRGYTHAGAEQAAAALAKVPGLTP